MRFFRCKRVEGPRGTPAAALCALLLAAPGCSLEGLAGVRPEATGGAGQAGAPSSTGSLTGGTGGASGSTGGTAGAAPAAYEAEEAKLYGKFEIGMDAAASAGAFAVVPEAAACSGSPDAIDSVGFTVSIAAAGKYAILARMSGDTGLDDSFFVTVDSGDSVNFQFNATGMFTETLVADAADKEAPIRYDLTAGDHTVVFTCRENGARLDWIQIVEAPP